MNVPIEFAKPFTVAITVATGPDALELNAGLFIVHNVELLQTTFVAGADPPEPANSKVKFVGPRGLVSCAPVTVTTVPPAGNPQFGEMLPCGYAPEV